MIYFLFLRQELFFTRIKNSFLDRPTLVCRRQASVFFSLSGSSALTGYKRISRSSSQGKNASAYCICKGENPMKEALGRTLRFRSSWIWCHKEGRVSLVFLRSSVNFLNSSSDAHRSLSSSVFKIT